ncbi:PilZ domain-containing protein [Urbifossiella limnaea]|uniref:PilZ domain-containing protein n=1 Tax=Urbifossiella limnaea TaxID=2528023 RepID=A0A517XPW0_9BACT|nr:PilZ domain-containing protein [Urbifossiella limnaea]QDU19551.1 hypothetical protein ETAA1_14800 [Urbifossiella limnaea]
MTAAPPSAERRIAPRRQPAMGTLFRLDSEGPPEIGLIWNISRTGVSMLRNEPPAAGAHVTGLLETLTDAHSLRVGMTVIHVKKLDTGDYFVGAHFDQALTDEQLTPFVV